MIGRYRTKPCTIEAIQWDGTLFRGLQIVEAFGALGVIRVRRLTENDTAAIHGNEDARLSIETLEGEMQAAPGDWIIRGLKGEFYPCKPDVFAMKYQPEPAVERALSLVKETPQDAVAHFGMIPPANPLTTRMRATAEGVVVERPDA